MIAWTAFEIGVNIYQSVLMLFFLKSRAHIVRKSRIPDVIAVTAFSALLSLYSFYPIPIPDTVGIVIFFLYLVFVSDDPWYISFLWCLFGFVVIAAITGIVLQFFTAILNYPYELIDAPGRHRLVVVLTLNLILFFVLFSLSRIHKDTSSLEWTVLLLFLGINAMSLAIIDSLYFYQVEYAFETSNTFFLPYAACVLISVFSVILLYTMTSLTRRKHRAEIALNHATLTKDYQQSIKELYTDMIARQHDFKHQTETIRRLVQNGDMDAAQAYFAAYEKKTDKANAAFVTGNLAMDALLTTKSIACANNHISFRFTHYPLNDLPISEVDLCAIVGNLLDNAIEAVNRITDPNEQRWVSLKFARVWDMFYITCENSFCPSTIRKRNGRFLTSKTEKPAIHGFGIPNIISTVTAYEGECSFDVKDQTFIARITLPY